MPTPSQCPVHSSLSASRFFPLQQDYVLPMGLGLFTRTLFQRKDRVADFSGEFVSLAEYERRALAGRGGYAVRCSATLFLDCYDHVQQGQCLASHALSPRNLRSLRDGHPAF